MKTHRIIFVFALITLALTYGGMAQANTATGNLWHVSEATSQNAIPANVPGTTPYVTFDVNSPFNFSGTSVTVGKWLGSGSAFNIVENTAGTLASLMDNGSRHPRRFTGFVSVTNGQTFTVTHDDGLTLIIGGLDLGFNPGPTSPVVTTATYTGPRATSRLTWCMVSAVAVQPSCRSIFRSDSCPRTCHHAASWLRPSGTRRSEKG